MSVLSIPVLLQLAAACGGPAVPDARMVATARVESGLNTLALHDNTDRRTYPPSTPEAMVATARALLAQGHSLDAGAMQINSGNWARLGLSAETVFDPQFNVCAGKRVLAEAYAAERRVSCRYNTGKPDCGDRYPNLIEAAWRQPASGEAPTPSSPPIPIDPTEPPTWDVWAHQDWQARKAEARAPGPAITITEATGEDQP